MSEVLFDIVFKGKFISQIDKPKAVLHFSKLFKMPVEKAEKFFDGTPRALKKSLNLEKASHFRAALKKAGLRVSMVKQIVEEPQQQESITMEEAGAVIVNKAFIQPKHFDTSQFHLDEAGVEIVHREPIVPIEFDLNQFHMDEVGTIFAEKIDVPELDIDISELSLDEVGAIFAEKKIVAEPELHIESITMEEVGATIVEKKKVPKPDINIDDIELLD